MRYLVVTAVIALIALLFYQPSTVNEDVWKSLRADQARCARVIGTWQTQGMIRRVEKKTESSNLIVDETIWARVERDTKVSVALATYCINSAPDGRHTVYVRGVRSDAYLGYIKNGNWWSP